MALIHVLDEVTANQIAAGEVVERPVNAVKEMVENAVDAGATDIEVEIADGGLTYIRVTDNGSGMSAEDAKLSIVRHATSKISTVDNIYHIASLGFRGEALASISAVSRTAITTRRQEDVEGTIVEVEGGTVSEVRPTGAPGGTTIEVRDLFYNVPARKKFLKSERTEASRINTMMGKLALANPDISFRLINNGRTVIETPGNGRLLDVVSALYGTKTAGEMLEVSGENERGILSGLISKPSLLKSSRQYQTIIINRRVVESSAVSKAVDNAYHSLLPKNGYPILVLAFTVAPESIDVNVHPQKREIKFSDEQSIFRLVYHSVLQSLTTKDTPNEIAREMIKDPGHQVAKESDFDLTSVKVEEARSVGPDIGLTEKEKDHARGIPMAIGSSGRRAQIESNLSVSGFTSYFSAIASGDEVLHGKPAPDIFLLAAKRLGVPPADCYVFEDSPNGIRAAHAAGMKPILIPDLMPVTEEIASLTVGVYKVLTDALEELVAAHR